MAYKRCLRTGGVGLYRVDAPRGCVIISKQKLPRLPDRKQIGKSRWHKNLNSYTEREGASPPPPTIPSPRFLRRCATNRFQRLACTYTKKTYENSKCIITQLPYATAIKCKTEKLLVLLLKFYLYHCSCMTSR